MNTTPLSLLEQLRQPNPQEPWARFVRLYTPLLERWGARLGLQGSDAADLVQDVFVTLVKKLPTFHYNAAGSFRNYLYTVLLNSHRMSCRRPALPIAAEMTVDQLAAAESNFGLEEQEYRSYLVHRALELMKSEFSEKFWKACWEHVVNDRPALEVAAELGISAGTVYVAKARVLTRLRQEVKGLLD